MGDKLPLTRALTMVTRTTKTKLTTNFVSDELMRPVCTQSSNTNWLYPTESDLNCQLMEGLSQRIARREATILELRFLESMSPTRSAAERISILETELRNLLA